MAEEKQEDTRQGLPENVNVEIADAPMELQEPIEGDDSQGFIKYGIWLEIRFSGKFAILMPTINYIGAQLISRIASSINRMEAMQ